MILGEIMLLLFMYAVLNNLKKFLDKPEKLCFEYDKHV
jgi:hypothetical protein